MLSVSKASVGIITTGCITAWVTRDSFALISAWKGVLGLWFGNCML